MSKDWHLTKAGKKYYGELVSVKISKDIVSKILKIAGKKQLRTGKQCSINDIVIELVNREMRKLKK